MASRTRCGALSVSVCVLTLLFFTLSCFSPVFSVIYCEFYSTGGGGVPKGAITSASRCSPTAVMGWDKNKKRVHARVCAGMRAARSLRQASDAGAAASSPPAALDADDGTTPVPMDCDPPGVPLARKRSAHRQRQRTNWPVLMQLLTGVLTGGYHVCPTVFHAPNHGDSVVWTAASAGAQSGSPSHPATSNPAAISNPAAQPTRSMAHKPLATMKSPKFSSDGSSRMVFTRTAKARMNSIMKLLPGGMDIPEFVGWACRKLGKAGPDVAAATIRKLAPLAAKSKDPPVVFNQSIDLEASCATILDGDLSDAQYTLVRKRFVGEGGVNVLPPLYKIKRYWKQNDVDLEEIKVGGKVVGVTMKDPISQVFIPAFRLYLQEWKKRHPTQDPASITHELKYKYGGDNFSFCAFNKKLINSEQFISFC
jgi:hypothetical protein